MNLHDCMLYAGIRTSRTFAKLTWRQRDFFYGLLNAAWPAGRFESDVGLLRAALYAPLLSKVSKRDVQDDLAECHRLGLIKLWTDEDGRGWGEVVNYRQLGLRKRKQQPDAIPGADPPAEPELFATSPPATRGPSEEEKERKKEGGRARGAAPAPAPDCTAVETENEWVARLEAMRPDVDVREQLALAVAAKRKQGRKLERQWFEDVWLPKCSATYGATEKGNGADERAQEPEPEAWKLHLKDNHEGESWAESAAAYPWWGLPHHVQLRISREMREARSKEAVA